MSVLSPAERYILAVDLGTSGAKVALISVDGRVAAWEAEPVELLVLPGGGAEQRPDDWWRALVAATRARPPTSPPSAAAPRARARCRSTATATR
jgi:xylulokinase